MRWARVLRMQKAAFDDSDAHAAGLQNACPDYVSGSRGNVLKLDVCPALRDARALVFAGMTDDSA